MGKVDDQGFMINEDGSVNRNPNVDRMKKKLGNHSYEINEFGEIIKSPPTQNESNGSKDLPGSDGMPNSFNKLCKIVWPLVKTIIFAYIGAFLSISLLPCWFSPIYNENNLIFYIVLILIVLEGFATYGRWLCFKEDKEYTFYRLTNIKRIVWAVVCVVLFLIMLFVRPLSFYNTTGVFGCIICKGFAFLKSYQVQYNIDFHLKMLGVNI